MILYPWATRVDPQAGPDPSPAVVLAWDPSACLLLCLVRGHGDADDVLEARDGPARVHYSPLFPRGPGVRLVP